MPAPPDSTIFGPWPPQPEDNPPKKEPTGGDNHGAETRGPADTFSETFPVWGGC
jgi:hypothetical protein